MRPIPAKDSSKHRAAVITPHTVFYGNGTAAPAQPGLHRSLLHILQGTLDRFEPHSTVVMEDVPLSVLEFQQESTMGWKHSKIEPWTVFRNGERTVSIGVRSAMTERHLGVLFDDKTDSGILALLLDRYYQSTGYPWRGTCAMSALNAIRLTWGNPRYEPLWNLPKECVKFGVGPLIWRRDLTDLEEGWGYVHTFDGNSAYLGSAITADLAWSRLHSSAGQRFDPGLPGYWLIDLSTTVLATLRDQLRPPVLGRFHDSRAWVTTPYARLLGEMGDPLHVVEAWVARAETRAGGGHQPAGSRILRAWGERSRDARSGERMPPAVEFATKRSYTDAIGAMQRDTMRVYRPDWAHTIIDLWRATLYRRILRVHKEIGYWPVRVATDSISYADSNPDPSILAQHVGAQARGDRPRRLGMLHHESTMTTAEWKARR